MNFQTEWDDKEYGKTPFDVVFPDGTLKMVTYMRDGLMLFTNGDSAEYERTGPGQAIIDPIEDKLHAILALENYKLRQ